MDRTDVVVVGGGVIGVATAYYLARRGQSVALLEQDQLCRGASLGNAGQITPAHMPLNQTGVLLRNLRWLLQPSSPLYVPIRFDLNFFAWLWRFHRACNPRHIHRATEILCRLGRASVELFDQLADEFDFRYRKPGRLEICRTQKALQDIRHEADLLQSFGFDYHTLSREELVEREPAVTGEVAGAVCFPDSYYCDPEQLVLNMAKAAERLGVQIHTETSATDLRVENDGSVRVVTPDREFHARAAVLACGAWPPRLAGRLGLRLPVEPGKGYHLEIDLPAVAPKTPLLLVEQRIFVTPYDGFLRLAGTMEFSGFNLRQHPARLKMLADGASRYLSGIDGANVRSRWCHLRPMSPDGLPMIGPAPRAPNVWIAAGHGMLGLTQGPITGKLIADALVDGRTSEELAALRPERFGNTT